MVEVTDKEGATANILDTVRSNLGIVLKKWARSLCALLAVGAVLAVFPRNTRQSTAVAVVVALFFIVEVRVAEVTSVIRRNPRVYIGRIRRP